MVNEPAGSDQTLGMTYSGELLVSERGVKEDKVEMKQISSFINEGNELSMSDDSNNIRSGKKTFKNKALMNSDNPLNANGK